MSSDVASAQTESSDTVSSSTGKLKRGASMKVEAEHISASLWGSTEGMRAVRETGQ
jgi:hypothetical protein